jgi:hypothetical protein
MERPFRWPVPTNSWWDSQRAYSRVLPSRPYKGKGVRLKGEYVRRKVGKTVA